MLLSAYLFTSGLSGFLFEPLADITNALVFVRFRLFQRANIRSNLADLLPINAGHNKLRLLINRDVDPRRNRILDRVRESQREYDRILPRLRAVTYANDLEFFGETFRNSTNCVRN